MTNIRKRKQNENVALRNLVVNECSCHFRESDGTYNYCSLEFTESNQCIFFTDAEKQRCKYFEDAVLLLNMVLQAQYYDKHSIQTDMHYNKCQNRKCKNIFLTPNKKDLFCSNECKESAARLAAKERKNESK